MHFYHLFIHVDKCGSSSSLLISMQILTLTPQSSNALTCCWPFMVISCCCYTRTSSIGKLRLREVYLPAWFINAQTQRADCLLEISDTRMKCKSLSVEISSEKPIVRSSQRMQTSHCPCQPGACQTSPEVRDAPPGQHTLVT